MRHVLFRYSLNFGFSSMKKKRFPILIFLTLAFALTCHVARSQSYLGISANIGNKLTFSPNNKDLFNRPVSVSGTITYIYTHEIKNDISVVLGAQAGVLAYTLSVYSRDTFSVTTDDKFVFHDYSTFVGKLDVVLAKSFLLHKKKLMAGVGAGVSYFTSVYDYNLFSLTVLPADGISRKTFSGEMAKPEEKLYGFAKCYFQYPITQRFYLALQYAFHWKPVLKGTYEFYHQPWPASGSMSLTPRELSLIFLYRLKRS